MRLCAVQRLSRVSEACHVRVCQWRGVMASAQVTVTVVLGFLAESIYVRPTTQDTAARTHD
jgi:hypothetical protein